MERLFPRWGVHKRHGRWQLIFKSREGHELVSRQGSSHSDYHLAAVFAGDVLRRQGKKPVKVTPWERTVV